MVSPQAVYLTIVCILTVVSFVYRYKKNNLSEYKTSGGIMAIFSQVICIVVTYFFLAGLRSSGYGIISWLIVFLVVGIGSYGIKYMIQDIIG